MCGILGLVSDKINEGDFSSALNTLNHRGPDNKSIVNLSNLILGHTRLSIIDVDKRSNQPLQIGQYTIIFNGEIFNYIELRQELRYLGVKFKTNSDTEVLLAAYDYWGKNFLSRLNGMWAFAIYDKSKKEIFMSRDRYGIKPLYFCKIGREFLFASEIKAILPLIDKRYVSKEEIIRFLIYGAQEHRQETMFCDIQRFPKSSYAIFDLETNNIEFHKFYEMDIVSCTIDNVDLNIEKTVDLLNLSVKYRLRSDVEVGMALSGGVDSNIIVLIANRLNKKIKAFTATYNNSKGLNEDYLTDKTIRRLHLEHFYKKVEIENYINDLEKIVWHQDEPFDTMGMIAQYAVYEKMKEKKIKVSLDGQGADEIFGGYKNYRVCILKKNFFKFSFYKDYLKSSKSQINSDFKILFASLFPRIFERLYFYKRSFKIFNGIITFVPSLKKMFYYPSDLNKRLNNDIDEHLSVLLRYADRNSMANSIEARCPFLDFNLINHAISLNENIKYKNGFSKYILRLSFNGSIDDQILWNKIKKGFPIPYESWSKNIKFQDKVKNYIKDSRLVNKLGINIDFDMSNPIFWKIFNLAIWEKVFNVELK